MFNENYPFITIFFHKMQDIYRWTVFAQSLGDHSHVLDSDIEVVGEAIQNLERQVESLRNKVSALESSRSTTELDIEAQNIHLRLFAQILYKKRKTLLLDAVEICIKRMKRLRYEVDSVKVEQIKSVSKEILEQIMKEHQVPKSFQIGISFSKLKRTIIKTLEVFEKASHREFNSRIIGKEISAHA
ncbi:unnamed protein product [Blepharisma stoltei]|uniref:Uncharacterized protein n=1 Tax=Blepharisma stoltei TaxID=1481888 RepID=A0AAU9J7U8_9CILI|nr:unnamed protein product [Blepharisma stoltei]